MSLSKSLQHPPDISADKITLSTYTNGKQSILTVPYYQRPYSWTTSNVAQVSILCDSWKVHKLIAILLEEFHKDAKSHFFLGNLVFWKKKDSTTHLGPHLIIDGQQRITTLMVSCCKTSDTLRFCCLSADIVAHWRSTSLKRNLEITWFRGLQQRLAAQRKRIGFKSERAQWIFFLKPFWEEILQKLSWRNFLAQGYRMHKPF